MTSIAQSPLGKKSAYIDQYSPQLLYPIARSLKRKELGIDEQLPFYGADIWNAYEVSWLNQKGKPMVAIAEIIVPYHSKNLVESKSLKLYLNSFNNTKFNDPTTVVKNIQLDLSVATEANVRVTLKTVAEVNDTRLTTFYGHCLDDLDIAVDQYQHNINFLQTENKWVEEYVYSDLLKSNCLVTCQPDWGSVQIHYRGKKINHEGLLKYLISFRNHNEFHEQCVERIFVDVMSRCQPELLTVNARYTRRGGLDINPYRSTEENIVVENTRQARQ